MRGPVRRKALSKKQRFAVFDRDNFTCRYCGKSPPEVMLEIDHIVPVVQGGGDDDANLITSCFPCNRGKGKRALQHGTTDAAHRVRCQEFMEQAQIAKQAKAAVAADKSLRNTIIGFWCEMFGVESMKPRDCCCVANIVKRCGAEKVFAWIQETVARGIPEWKAARYLCGIVHNHAEET